jgi:hypothetical protein
VFSQTLSFGFFDTPCGILDLTPYTKMHRLVRSKYFSGRPTQQSYHQIENCSHNVSVGITTFVLAHGDKVPLDAQNIWIL